MPDLLVEPKIACLVLCIGFKLCQSMNIKLYKLTITRFIKLNWSYASTLTTNFVSSFQVVLKIATPTYRCQNYPLS